MKRFVFLGLMIILGGLISSFRVTQGIDEAGRALVKAYKVGAKEKAPYLYHKSKGYREISAILASEADDVGSRVFAIRTMNSASKAITAAFVGTEELSPVEDLPEEVKKEGLSFQVVDLKELKSRIDFLRNNRGMFCAPKELGRAEAFYDGLVFEMKKEQPNTALVLRFYNEVSTESKIAESKLRVAMDNEFECYTGEKKVAKKPPPEPEPAVTEEEKEEPVEEQEVRVDLEEKEKQPQLIEEPLKITARIHFDFDRYNIKREYIPILNEVVKTLKENEFVKVRIEGFTDIIGPKEYNVKLAQRRANTVKNYLVKHGIPEDKIEIVGFGKERFIASNEESIGRLTNRRVEFIVIKFREE